MLKHFIVTGGSGFIGGQIADHLQRSGHEVVFVDKRPPEDPTRLYMHADALPHYLKQGDFDHFDGIVHMGACTNTLYGLGMGDRAGLEKADQQYLKETNTDYSKLLWEWCSEKKKPFIYASSAATYGDGKLGFSEDLSTLMLLQPLNPYGKSKHEFDLWAIESAAAKKCPPIWAGLKFFNVYGKTEASKGKMASMVYQLFTQARETGKVRLFTDGEQKRDFVWVGDIVKIIDYMLFPRARSSVAKGLFNIGTGKGRTFNEVAKACFAVLGKPVQIEYFDMPEQLKPAYQNFSEAKLDRLKSIGYNQEFTSIEDALKTFVSPLPIP